MNKFRFYFILLITTIILFSCSKNNNDIAIEPIRDFQEQFNADNILIEKYLNTHYISITNSPGETQDQDVVITKIPEGGSQLPIMYYLNNATFPKLLVKEITYNENKYNMYYLVLREGTGDSPTNADSVLASYSENYLYETTVSDVSTLSAISFKKIIFPQQLFPLLTTIRGWGEIFPKFKTGTYTEGANGKVIYSDFGAGVMFIPSGFGYFASGSGSIPSYSPLVFSFKLYALQRLDQDRDGVPSYLEDLNNDGYMESFASGVVNPDDTDGDGIPNFLDVDDDGDGYTTKLEIKNPVTGLPFPFDQIPTCASGKKNYLDATCHP